MNISNFFYHKILRCQVVSYCLSSNTGLHTNKIQQLNKNAFQQDAYRPQQQPPGVSASVHARIPPEVWAWRPPPQVWAWRPPPGYGFGDPPGCGPGDPPGVGLETYPIGQTPQLPPWVWAWRPARYAGIPPPQTCYKACWDTTFNACWDTTPLRTDSQTRVKT